MADLHPDNPYAPDRFPDPKKPVEFPAEAKAKFDYILTRYPTKEAALLPTLHLAQEVWGWISPEAVLYVGTLLDLSPATVFGVVSFYNMYNQKPVGKYHLQVCTNLSCMVNRAYDIYDPWLATTVDREAWVLTLKTGKQVQLVLPLDAAVELETAGFAILAGYVTS